LFYGSFRDFKTAEKNMQEEKANILIIDDDLNILHMIEISLRSEYKVVTLFQAEKALEVFKLGDFDVVITDIRMPYVSGFEILRTVKEVNELVEVILLTGELPDKAKPAVSALQAGAYDYLIKPIRLEELKRAIRRALERKQQRVKDKRYLQELIRLANTDCLTGLSNRRHLYSQFHLEFERSNRYCRNLSCLVLDVDKFKRVNDTYGHRCGDLVLQRIGALLTKHSRSSDVKCRYGGEEFVLVLPEANEEGALAMAEKLRCLVENDVQDLDGQAIKLTISLGLATYKNENFQTAEQLLNAADLALLSAKRAGGNCTRLFDKVLYASSSLPTPPLLIPN
jgi:diguanylate cyclase (GGDEF)-like protein